MMADLGLHETSLSQLLATKHTFPLPSNSPNYPNSLNEKQPYLSEHNLESSLSSGNSCPNSSHDTDPTDLTVIYDPDNIYTATPAGSAESPKALNRGPALSFARSDASQSAPTSLKIPRKYSTRSRRSFSDEPTAEVRDEWVNTSPSLHYPRTNFIELSLLPLIPPLPVTSPVAVLRA